MIYLSAHKHQCFGSSPLGIRIVRLAQKCLHLPTKVQSVLARCLASDLQQRFHDGSEVHEALRAVFGSLRSLKNLLDEALAGMQLEREDGDDHYRVRVALDDGRSQWVHVELTQGPEFQEEIIRAYSVCGPTCPDYFEKALELNARLSFGAIGIEALPDGNYFVMADSFPRATCDREELRASLLAIAAHADKVERLLTGDDRH